MKKQIKELTEFQKEYNNIVNKYLLKFVNKHGYEFSDWVSSEVGGLACFIEQYFFNFSDIKFDIDNNIKKGLIFKWQEDGVEYISQDERDENYDNINFKSYTMGLRFPEPKDKELIVVKNKSRLKIICFDAKNIDMSHKVRDKFNDCKITKKGEVFPNSLVETPNSNKNYYQYFKIQTKLK